ncbi:hypothetical protein Tco_0810913, partial [Tanacetum coccineum]
HGGCLERTDGNAEFHQIVDFLTTSSIYYALTQIHATIDGKTVVISESSVRSDLHFNDEDGITCLSNDEIFVNLALMGYERVSTKLTFKKGTVTPLFASMLVPQVVKGEGSGQPSKPQPPSSTAPPSHEEQVTTVASQPQKTHTPRRAKRGSGLRCQDTTLRDACDQTMFETTSKQSRDPPLSEVNTSGSGEDSMEHQDDLMDFIPPTHD